MTVAHAFDDNQALGRDTGNASPARGLNFLWLEITRKCNLACIHCYTESSPALPLRQSMTDKDWIDALTDARHAGCRSVQFIGGEPTLHTGLEKFIAVAYALGYDFIEVFTNATSVTDRLIDCFLSYNVRVATSFYAADSAIHTQITTQDGSFAKTVRGIKRLVAGGIPLRVEVIEMGPNDGQFRATEKYLKSLGVRRVSRDRIRQVGRGTSPSALAFSMGDLCGQCWKNRLCITANGVAYPCIMSRGCAVGNFHAGGIAGLLSAEPLHEFRDAMQRETGASVRPVMAVNADACGPDNCAPNDDACGPDNCAPNDGACGPDNCAPNDDTCGPRNCGPYDAACGPEGDACGPQNCAPNDDACGPDNCAPNDGACGPDNCAPNDDTCGPRNCGPYDLSCAPNDGGGGVGGGVCGPDIVGGCAPGSVSCGPATVGRCGPDRGDPFSLNALIRWIRDVLFRRLR